MATNDIGRVTPIWRGFYSAATTYELNDIVIDTAGSVWWHKSEELTTGVIPEVGEIWDAVIDMSVFSGLIQAAITTAQTALEAAQAAVAEVTADTERAETAADNAENSAAAAFESAAGVGALAQAAERSAEAAAGSATGAAGSAAAAAGSKSDAEAYAVGTRGGEDVGSTDPTYHNNAKYYAEQAASEAEAAAQSAEDAQDVLDSIPEDYSQLSADIDNLKTHLYSPNTVDLSDPALLVKKGLISGTTGNWYAATKYSSCFVPIPADALEIGITANDNEPAVLGLLTSSDVVNGNPPPYATGCGREVVAAGTTKTFSIPDDAKYACIMKQGDNDNTPESTVLYFPEYVTGKEFDSLKDDLFTFDSVDFSDPTITVKAGLISSTTGNWTTGAASFSSYFIPITGNAQKISVSANNDNAAVLAFLTSDEVVNGNPPPYAAGCTREAIAAGTTNTFQIPADAKYACIMKKSGTNTDNTPLSTEIRVDYYEAYDQAAKSAAQIAQNTSDIAQNTSDIAQNTSDIAQNTSDIAQNTGDIAQNTGDIAQNTGDIAQNTSDIAQNTSDIAENTGDIANLKTHLYSPNIVDLSDPSLLVKKGLISSTTGNWYAATIYSSCFVPIPADALEIEITANDNEPAVLGLLTSSDVVNGNPPPYAAGCGREVIAAGTTKTFRIPTDAKYACIIKQGGNDNTPALTVIRIPNYGKSNVNAGITHATPESVGQLSVVRRCRQLTDIKWTPAVDLPRISQWIGDGGGVSTFFEDVFKAGVEYTGIPYGQAQYHAADYGYSEGPGLKVGWNVGFDTFISAVSNPNSSVSTESMYDDQSGHHYATLYATVCTALCGYALDFDTYAPSQNFVTVHADKLDRLGTVGSMNLTDLKMGDLLYTTAHGAIITDIIADSQGVKAVEISEATTVGNDNWNELGTQYGGKCRRLFWQVDTFRTKWSRYAVYRRKNIEDVTYQQSPYVDTGDEGDINRTHNFACIPYMGENFAYKAGKINGHSEILTPAYKSGVLDKLRVKKDGADWNADGTTNYYDVSGTSVDVHFSEAGTYSAYLCGLDGSEEINGTVACHWTVI